MDATYLKKEYEPINEVQVDFLNKVVKSKNINNKFFIIIPPTSVYKDYTYILMACRKCQLQKLYNHCKCIYIHNLYIHEFHPLLCPNIFEIH